MPKRTQQERSADSAHRLMQAAIELIGERGWEKTTISEISSRAGYSKAMVSVRYGGKEALLESLQRSYEERFTLASVEGATGLEEVLAHVANLREVARTDEAYLRAFLTLCFETVGPIDSLRPWIDDWFTRFVAVVAAAVARGQADGSIRRDLDPRAEAQFFLAAGSGICFTWVLRPEAIDFDSALADWGRRVAHWLSS